MPRFLKVKGLNQPLTIPVMLVALRVKQLK